MSLVTLSDGRAGVERGGNLCSFVLLLSGRRRRAQQISLPVELQSSLDDAGMESELKASARAEDDERVEINLTISRKGSTRR
jgi:hypothetical protein